MRRDDRSNSTETRSRGSEAARVARVFGGGKRLLLRTIGLALAGALLATSCGQEQAVYLRISDLLPVLELQAGTGRILPASGPAPLELGAGWVGSSSNRTTERNSVRVRSRRAELNLLVVAPGDLELVFEARALSAPPDGSQSVTVVLNDERLDRFDVGLEYEAYSLTLPARVLRAGRNLVALEFAALGPVKLDDVTDLGAARIRNLEIRSFPGRPARPPRSEDSPSAAIDPATAGGGPGAQPRSDTNLLMPADTLLELALEVPEGARISADLIRSLADPIESEEDTAPRTVHDAADLFASIEVVGPTGTAEVIFEHDFGGGSLFRSSNRASLDHSLERWSGEVMLLRLRVWGGVEGHVSWQDLRITCDCEDSPPAYMACDLPQTPSSGRLGRPDIFIILLDAARADAFSTFGATRPTPSVDSLAAEGTKFTRAASTSYWTAPSTASLLSGRYPDAHGVEDWDRRLPASITTLAEILSDAGYFTFLGSQHHVYRGNQPLLRGFEEVTLIGRGQRSTLPDSEGMLRPDRPTFAFIHLLPPHGPYEPPPPFKGIYTGDSPTVIDVSADNLHRHSRDQSALSDEAVRYVRDRYDENVAFADALVGRIVAELEHRDRYDEALVILLADHGEAFFEHGEFLHRPMLHNEVLRIPLIMKWPTGTTGYPPTMDLPVSLVDVAPTLVDGLGIHDPRASFQGTSLLPAIFEGSAPNRLVYATTRPRGRSGRREIAAYRGKEKLILDESGVAHLYDLSIDPQEQNSVASAHPVKTRLFLQELLAQQRCSQLLLEGAGPVPQIELDTESLRDLRALGYIQ